MGSACICLSPMRVVDVVYMLPVVDQCLHSSNITLSSMISLFLSTKNNAMARDRCDVRFQCYIKDTNKITLRGYCYFDKNIWNFYVDRRVSICGHQSRRWGSGALISVLRGCSINLRPFDRFFDRSCQKYDSICNGMSRSNEY